MIPSLADIVLEEAVPISLRRKSGGGYDVNGEWTGEVETVSTIQATIQPVTNANALLSLPEGEREDVRYFLWTTEALALDDVVTYGGDDYRISRLWVRPEGGFTKAAVGLLRA